MKKGWLDDIRTRLEQHEEPAPEGLWESIEAQISTEETAKARPVIPVWAWSTVSIAAVAVIAFFIFFNPKEEELTLIREHQEVALTTEDISKNILPPENPDPIHTEVIPTTPKKREKEQPVQVVSESTETQNIEISPDTDLSEIIPDNREQIQEEYPEEEYPEEKATVSVPAPEERHGVLPNLKITNQKGTEKEMTISLFSQNTPGNSHTQNGFGRDYIQTVNRQQEEHDDADISAMSKEIIFFNQYREIKETTEHRMPISAGITLSYPLSEKVAIDAGLTYTYLSSKTRRGTEEYYEESLNEHHFIGIPLGIKYTIWNRNGLSLYLSGGGEVKRSISSTTHHKYTMDFKEIASHDQNKNDALYLWSVRGAVGVRYNIMDGIGLFAEPGITYHLKTNDLPSIIYNQTPLNFSLSFGINIHL